MLHGSDVSSREQDLISFFADDLPTYKNIKLLNAIVSLHPQHAYLLPPNLREHFDAVTWTSIIDSRLYGLVTPEALMQHQYNSLFLQHVFCNYANIATDGSHLIYTLTMLINNPQYAYIATEAIFTSRQTMILSTIRWESCLGELVEARMLASSSVDNTYHTLLCIPPKSPSQPSEHFQKEMVKLGRRFCGLFPNPSEDVLNLHKALWEV